MPLDFPPSPSTGQTLTGLFGEVYTWDGQKWTLTAGGGGGGAFLPLAGGVMQGPITLAGDATQPLQPVAFRQLGPPTHVGPSAPSNPNNGDLWLNTAEDNKLYVWDGSSWVPSSAPVTGFLPLAGGVVGPLTVRQALFVDGGDLAISGGLWNIYGTTTIKNPCVVDGGITLYGNIWNPTGTLTIANNVNVTGSIALTGSIWNTGGTLTIDNNLNITGGITFTGTIWNPSGVGITTTLDVASGATFRNGIALYGDIWPPSGSAGWVGALVVSTNLTVWGAAYTPGAVWHDASDERLKDDVQSYTSGLAQIMALRPVSYRFNGKGGWRADGKTYHGLVAQEARDVMPELVVDISELPDALDGQLGTNLGPPLTLALVNAVQELAKEVHELKRKR